MKKKYFGILGSALLVFSVPFSSGIWAASDREKEAEREIGVIKSKLKRSLARYDMNEQEKFIIDPYFTPSNAMPVYRELLLWGGVYPQKTPPKGDLDGIVRTGLGAVIAGSGVGVPLADWEGEGRPISLIYAHSTPKYVHKPDFSNPGTLAWQEEHLVKKIMPSAAGKSIGAKALWITHDSSEAAKAAAPMMLASLLTEVDILNNRLLVRDKTGKAVFAPESLKQNEAGDWEVLGNRNLLYTQASLLQGLSYLHQLLVDDRAASLFSAGKVQGKSREEWLKLTSNLMDLFFRSMSKHHYDPDVGSFVDSFDAGKGRNREITLTNAAAAVTALDAFMQTLSVNDPRKGAAKSQLLAQADYVKTALESKKRLLVPKGYLVTKKIPIKGTVKSLSNPVAVMTIFVTAGLQGEKERYSELMQKVYEDTSEHYWTEYNGVYRSARGYTVSSYNGLLFSSVLRWMRLMAQSFPELSDFEKQGEQLIKVVLKEGGLLQGEEASQGEPLSPEDFTQNDVPKLVNELGEMNEDERVARLTEFLQSAVDQDGDGVPGVRFAGGRFGAAPVVITEAGVNTPFPDRAAWGAIVRPKQAEGESVESEQ